MKKIIAVLTILSLCGCAGRAANPVTVNQYGDSSKSCTALITEMQSIENQIALLLPKTNKTGKNVALGVAGWFFIVPWFFMDLSQSEQEEVNAYRQRYNSLAVLATDKKCDRADYEN